MISFNGIYLFFAFVLSIAVAFGVDSASHDGEGLLSLDDANESPGTNPDSPEPADDLNKFAYVIPIRDQIGPPVLDILRRGMKIALKEKATIVVLDMDTPGGELGVTLEIMQEIIATLERFDGTIITYVNREAKSLLLPSPK